ncbi:MAG: Uncharacterised protein [Opitutia bacterium UBA7350]|nr:MAG: Uncharacterised protein [Opitutae bacterium UBA7350]
MNFKLKHLASFIAFGGISLLLAHSSYAAKVSPETRIVTATAQLENKPNLIAVYAKGFVCNSCGIGIRIHLSKIDSVDLTSFNRGVEMDPAQQLLFIAFKPGVEPDLEVIHRAIYDAGYEPDLYYRWTDSGLIVAPLPPLN